MFSNNPKARTDLKSGTLYAVTDEAGWIYYGQVTAEKMVGFFRRRDREVADSTNIFVSKLMGVITVSYPSITRALRTGLWTKLGRFQLHTALLTPTPTVQWSVGTLDVSVWEGDGVARITRVEDPLIQNFELMAVWDAVDHIPARLSADFGEEEPEWHVGGPIWRERKVKEEMAKRFPDAPWHQLPADWVPTNIK